jgi:hypothetical protein
MLTIIAIIIGNIVLTLLAVIGLIYLSNWLGKLYGTKIRRLLRTPLPNTADDAGQPREKTNQCVEPAYPIQNIYESPKAREQVDVTGINPMYRTGEKQKEKRNAKYHNANIKCLSHLYSLILNGFRRKVNQSGKEPGAPHYLPAKITSHSRAAIPFRTGRIHGVVCLISHSRNSLP